MVAPGSDDSVLATMARLEFPIPVTFWFSPSPLLLLHLMAEGGGPVFSHEFTNKQLLEWLRQKLGSEINLQSFIGEYWDF